MLVTSSFSHKIGTVEEPLNIYIGPLLFYIKILACARFSKQSMHIHGDASGDDAAATVLIDADGVGSVVFAPRAL